VTETAIGHHPFPPIEIGRLAVFQRHPLRFIERRAETVELIDDHYYKVTIDQQFLVPFHNSRDRKEREILVPLGVFGKDRVPDLVVTGPQGERLPVLTREMRSVLLAVVFLSGWERTFFNAPPEEEPAGDEDLSVPEREDEESADDGDPSPPEAEGRRDPGEDRLAVAVWSVIRRFVTHVNGASEREALAAIDDLRATLEEIGGRPDLPSSLERGIAHLLTAEPFWRDLGFLARRTLGVAQMRASPGSTYVIRSEHSERFLYRELRAGNGRFRRLLAWLRPSRVLAALGLISVSLYRQVANAGMAQSLWVFASPPEGVEAVRFYWADQGDQLADANNISSRRTVLGRTGAEEAQLATILDVQIEPGSAVATAAIMATFLIFVATYIFQQLPELEDQSTRTLIIAMAALFAAIPASVVGGIAYRERSFARRLNRGPQLLIISMSILAGFLAIVISLRSIGALAKWLSFSTAIWALFVAGVMTWVRFGPRWRKNESSRMRSRTSRASPDMCGDKQTKEATLFLVGWLAFTVFFARCVYALQEQRIFTSHFPANIWHAWWSWF
jgi:hypothetical protein